MRNLSWKLSSFLSILLDILIDTHIFEIRTFRRNERNFDELTTLIFETFLHHLCFMNEISIHQTYLWWFSRFFELMLNSGRISTQLQGTRIGPGRSSVGDSSITSKVNTRRVIRVISIPRTRVMLVHRLLVPGILHRRRNGTIRATIIPNTLSSTIIEAWAAYFNGAMIARAFSKSQSGVSIDPRFVRFMNSLTVPPCLPTHLFS